MSKPSLQKPDLNSNQKSANNSQAAGPVTWFNRIDYGILIKKAGFLFWENRRRLIVLSVFLLLTGGQAITGGSSFSSGGNFSGSSQEKSEEDWKSILNNIESQDRLKNQVRSWATDQETLYAAVFVGLIALTIVLTIALLLFFLNCHLHLLLIKNVSYLSRGEKKSPAAIKKEVKGRWKKLVYLRLIFGLMYLGVFLVFLLPAGLFALQKSWAMAVMLVILGLLSIMVAFIILGYVFRYSLFYFILANLSIRESIDKGYDLFVKNWKESVLASIVNFALGIIAGLSIFFLVLLALVGLVIVGGLIWGMIYLLMAMAHPWEIAIGVGIFAVIILLCFVIFLAAAWQAFVVIFWHSVFSELAGCKTVEEARAEVKEATQTTDSGKDKKPVVKPVIQKEEE